MKFKIGDRVKIKSEYFIKEYCNQIGTVVGFGFKSKPCVLFDNKELNTSPLREGGVWAFSHSELELYTMDQTKRDLLD